MIRTAAKEDLESVYKLIRQLTKHDFTPEQFKTCYLHNLKNNHILVWEEDGNVCGCGVLTVHYSLHYSRKSAEIVNLIVDADYRNLGIGRKLLLALEQIAINNKCVGLEVGSGQQREAAHRFYYREGFGCSHYKFTKSLTIQ